jgi:hypothetical protein
MKNVTSAGTGVTLFSSANQIGDPRQIAGTIPNKSHLAQASRPDIANVQVRRFPTRLHVICTCGHQAHVSAFIDKVPRLRCTICGNKNPRIAAADRSRSWSMRRMGR